MKRFFVIINICVLVLGMHAQNSKLSPFVRKVLMTHGAVNSASKAKGVYGNTATVPAITAFVRTNDTDALRSEGCHIYAQWNVCHSPTGEGSIVIASIPLNKVMKLARMPQIQRIEAGQSCSVTNDTTAIITKARDVWSITPSQANDTQHPTPNTYNGKGIVVGVMDVGFDLTHPTFYSADMSSYRIRAFWDQLDTLQTGSPILAKTAAGLDTIYIGRQYTTQEELLNKAHATDAFICTHGTHTTGTAAGSGAEGSSLPTGEGRGVALYSGMAPYADICLVCNNAGDNSALVPDSLKDQYTNATDMLGFKYIFDYADSQGKPCVINFSEGAYDDFYNSELYNEVLSEMIGPGHIICASAGNEGWHNTYISKTVGTERAGAFLTTSSESALYTLCSDSPALLTLTFYPSDASRQEYIYDTSLMTDYPDSVFTDTIVIADQSYRIDISTYHSCYDDSKYATELGVTNLQHKSIDSSIPVSLALLGKDNSIEAFCLGSYFKTSSLDPTLNNTDNTHCILFPGSGKDVICVGNVAYRQGFYNYKGKWRAPFNDGTKDGIISIYSSLGPSLSGLTKPDVCAPGMNIISSFSSYYREANPTTDLVNEARQFNYNGRRYAWEANSGTSMASPVVTGIIALWLQVCPTLTPDQIRDVFAHTCTHYDESLSYPNNTYGYGTIDALAGMEYILETYTGIRETENGERRTENAIYSLDGRKINDITNQHGIFIISDNGVTKKVIR